MERASKGVADFLGVGEMGDVSELERTAVCIDCGTRHVLSAEGYFAWQMCAEIARTAKLRPQGISEVSRCAPCAVKFRAQRDQDATRQYWRVRGLLDDLKRAELPPDQLSILEVHGYGPAMERIRRERDRPASKGGERRRATP